MFCSLIRDCLLSPLSQAKVNRFRLSPLNQKEEEKNDLDI